MYNPSVDLPSDEAAWASVLAAAPAAAVPSGATGPLWDLFGPLLPLPEGRPLVFVHLAQSLDGCIATHCGRSQWITGEPDLVHTHRLRALSDAVLVGARTVEADDPRLTVRRCAGRDPLRVVLDPSARLSGELHVLDGAAPTLLVSTLDAPCPPGVERLVLPSEDGVIDPVRLLAALYARGLRRILVEGGGVTAARLLQAGCVDRLHLTIAPVLIGGGRRAIPLPLADTLDRAPRPASRMIRLGPDWLVDCDLRG